ncbi:MAG: hypothetical protein WBP40_03540 [Candidatus Moraniibacteriota bacterium]
MAHQICGQYWFQPKRLVGGIAVYYPSSWGGALLLLVMILSGVVLFRFIDAASHSTSDTLIGFAHWAVALLAFFDLLCFRLGEYPSWWKQGKAAAE